MRGVIATGSLDPAVLAAEAQEAPTIEGSDLVQGVTCAEPFDWVPKPDDPPEGFQVEPVRRSGRPLRVAAYDFGMKWNILRRFTAYGCRVSVFPARTPAKELLAAKPDGIFLSNGPGDPTPLDYATTNARELLDADVPIFGICLGHQVLGLAMGARTYKVEVWSSGWQSSSQEPRNCEG